MTALTCQGPSCDHEFHDSVLDPHEAIVDGFEPRVWSLDRPHPEHPNIGTQTLQFCSDTCVREWLEAKHGGDE